MSAQGEIRYNVRQHPRGSIKERPWGWWQESSQAEYVTVLQDYRNLCDMVKCRVTVTQMLSITSCWSDQDTSGWRSRNRQELLCAGVVSSFKGKLSFERVFILLDKADLFIVAFNWGNTQKIKMWKAQSADTHFPFCCAMISRGSSFSSFFFFFSFFSLDTNRRTGCFLPLGVWVCQLEPAGISSDSKEEGAILW